MSVVPKITQNRIEDFNMKICTNPHCKQINPQPLTSFHKNKSKKDGLSSNCSSCEKTCASKYRKTPEWKQADARRHKKYEQTDKGRNNHKRYLQTSKGKSKHRSIQAARRALKLKATPPWLTKELRNKIQEFYDQATKLTKETGIQHEVDHVVPLQGKNVSGLHVPWNLQVLPAFGPNGNRFKGNKHPSTCDSTGGN